MFNHCVCSHKLVRAKRSLLSDTRKLHWLPNATVVSVGACIGSPYVARTCRMRRVTQFMRGGAVTCKKDVQAVWK
jgi:hypothetical protein